MSSPAVKGRRSPAPPVQPLRFRMFESPPTSRRWSSQPWILDWCECENKTAQVETRDSALSVSSPLLNSYPRKGKTESLCFRIYFGVCLSVSIKFKWRVRGRVSYI